MKYPDLILGTALWAWTIDRRGAFQLLDRFYQAGFRQIDAATNYPINKDPADFRAAEKILLEWISSHGISDLQIIMKVGSLNNLHTPQHNLSPAFLSIMSNEYLFLLGRQLHQLMIHWDNRDDPEQIRQSLAALEPLSRQGIRIGLSGIRFPDLYAKINEEFLFDFDIQFKHNLIYSDYARYGAFHGKRRFLAYGINAGGLKFDEKQYHNRSSASIRAVPAGRYRDLLENIRKSLTAYNARPGVAPVTQFNQCSMTYAFYSPDIKGILIGPSGLQQLEATLAFYEDLRADRHRALFLELSKLKADAQG